MAKITPITEHFQHFALKLCLHKPLDITEFRESRILRAGHEHWLSLLLRQLPDSSPN